MSLKKTILIILSLFPLFAFPQGFNKVWMLGTGGGFPTGKIEYSSNSYSLFQQPNKMKYKGTQATISDANGNFLMSSNGVWIANAKNDTMLNGSGLNPGYFVNLFPNGLVIDNGNVFLPFPGDSNKYYLIHQTEDDTNYPSNRLYYSVIDMTLDSGFGGVTIKNDTLINDTLAWGIAACKHANGRDWWIACVKDNTDTLCLILVTANGIASVTKQSLGFGYATPGNASQIKFSEAGDKLVYSYSVFFQNKFNSVLCDFDRCSGLISNTHIFELSNYDYLWGLAFSPSGNFLYACTAIHIFQVNTNTFQYDTVAIYDGFCFPNNPWCTTFWDMYLAANGKIYITSGSAVMFIHEMNYPDSADTVCDVQQHSIFLDSIWNLRAVPNHPNYYLGPLQGSPCDTLQWTGVDEQHHDFRFRIYPNPVTNNNLHIGYLLPQNKSGTFQIYDITGKVVFKYNLPQWSNEQSLKLPQLANGIYSASIISDNKRVSKILAIMNE